MKLLGTVIRDLIKKRGISQKDLAKIVKMSPVSMSQIVTGKAKPRQINLTRIMQALCFTAEDEQRLISAYYNAEGSLADSPVGLERPVEEDNEARVKRYLEMKIASVRLKQKVEGILLQEGVEYKKDYINENLICDFYLPAHNLILECKANRNRDWDRVEITASFLNKKNNCSTVWVVTNNKNTSGRDSDEYVLCYIDSLKKRLGEIVLGKKEKGGRK